MKRIRVKSKSLHSSWRGINRVEQSIC